MSKSWINKNLRHPVYGYRFFQSGIGYNNFISSSGEATLYSKKYIKTIIKVNKQDHYGHVSKQWLAGFGYSHNVKPRYYRLRKPSSQELNYLKSNYVKHIVTQQ